MPSIQEDRVDGKGRRTGSATLSVERVGNDVFVGLGLLTVKVPLDRWKRLMRNAGLWPVLPGED